MNSRDTYIHPLSGEESAILRNFSKKKSTVLCTTATYIGALATSFIWKSLAKVPQNLLLLLIYVHESGISENTQKRQTSIPKSIIPEWADNFFCQYAAEQVSCFLSDHCHTTDLPCTCRIDQALCRNIHVTPDICWKVCRCA